MTFRITPHRQIEQTLTHTQRHYVAAAQLQNQISSGVRVHRPSEDPAGQRTILNQQRLVAQLQTQLESIGRAKAIAQQSSQQLLEVNRLLVQARTLALEARQATEASELSAIALEIEGYLTTLGSIANARFDGLALFGGAEPLRTPYSVEPDGHLSYRGGQVSGGIVLTEEGEVPVFLAGPDVFQFRLEGDDPPQDLFVMLQGLVDDLRGRETMSSDEWGAKIDSRIHELEVAGDHLREVIGKQSVVLQRLDRLQTRSEDLLLGARQTLTEIQSPDFAAAVVRLQEEQNLLQYSLATITRIFAISILDDLR